MKESCAWRPPGGCPPACLPPRCFPLWLAVNACGWPWAWTQPGCQRQPRPEPPAPPCLPPPCWEAEEKRRPRPVCIDPGPWRNEFCLQLCLPPEVSVERAEVAVGSVGWVSPACLEVCMTACVTYRNRCGRECRLERAFRRQLPWREPGLPELSILGRPRCCQQGQQLRLQVCLGQRENPPLE